MTMTEVIAELVNRLPNVGSKPRKGKRKDKGEGKVGEMACLKR